MTYVYDFAEQRRQWSNPPVDDVGYLAASELLAVPDAELRGVVERMELTRYGGWRNHANLWREVLGLDSTTGACVLDLGCGVGVEALQYLRAGNEVDLADISRDNLRLAERVLQLRYPDADPCLLEVADEPPYVPTPPRYYDVIHCVGVLHHVPHARELIERCHELTVSGGELRLMLYSDEGWRRAVGTEPPAYVVVDPGFARFVAYFDSVGSYADWYDREKLTTWFGDLYDVERFEYITPWRQYLAAVLRRKP